MDTSMTIALGVAAGLGGFAATRIRRKRNQVLALSIEAALRAQGALTLPALTDALGLKGFSARGKVIMALGDMVSRGRVRTIAAPDGTPQLQKVNSIKYELASSQSVSEAIG